ncbi:ABC transporter permease [uncultured Jatrophihabitans sp.]|uniref:ABC transporter permease n=1 Tax=uncultured Jatrophihabitans sp. TaxID=1610747 RepID=UPI0035CA9E80
MTRYVIGRVLQAIAVLWAAYTVAFAVLYLLPSNPIALQLTAAGIDTTSLKPAQLHAAEARFGLDKPVIVQYFDHLGGFLHGNLGTSITRDIPVTQVIGDRIDSTLLLSLVAGAVALIWGTALAYLASYVRVRWLRLILSRLPAFGASLPQFLTGLLLIQFLSFQLGWLPSTGQQGWKSLVMPSITISLITGSVLAQVLMRSFEDVMRQPHIATARAKGLSRGAVQLRHGLRNAALPALTILGVIVGLTVTSSVVVETEFNRQGVGSLTQDAVSTQDIPVVLAIVMIAATLFVVVNLVVDLLYPLLDPRISHYAKAA